MLAANNMNWTVKLSTTRGGISIRPLVECMRKRIPVGWLQVH
jgi:hypothetical protein